MRKIARYFSCASIRSVTSRVTTRVPSSGWSGTTPVASTVRHEPSPARDRYWTVADSPTSSSPSTSAPRTWSRSSGWACSKAGRPARPSASWPKTRSAEGLSYRTDPSAPSTVTTSEISASSAS